VRAFVSLPEMQRNHVARLTVREAVRTLRTGVAVAAEPIPEHRAGSGPLMYAPRAVGLPQELATWAKAFDMDIFELAKEVPISAGRSATASTESTDSTGPIEGSGYSDADAE
jgi:hypothetical protein